MSVSHLKYPKKYFELFRARDPNIFHLYHDSSCGKIKDRQARFLIDQLNIGSSAF